MKPSKKGAELSLNVIIIAAIALIVLVILVLIFTGRISVFRFGVEDCYTKGGICQATCSSDQGQVEIAGTNCGKQGITPPQGRTSGDYAGAKCCLQT